MKRITMTALCVGAALAGAGASSVAEPPENTGKARATEAMQIKIDRKTGKKTAGDDAAAVPAIRSAKPAGDDGIVPSRSLPAEQHADGSLSAQLGEDAMEYLVLTIDEDGNKVLTHKSAEQARQAAESTSAREER